MAVTLNNTSAVSGWGFKEGWGPVAYRFVAYQPSKNLHHEQGYRKDGWFFGYVGSDQHPTRGRDGMCTYEDYSGIPPKDEPITGTPAAKLCNIT